MTTSKLSKLYRSEKDKVIGGVCGGLGEFLNIDPVILRIIFVLMTIFGGGGILVYFVLWIVIPSKSKLGKKSEDYIKENVEELKTKSKDLAGKEPKVILGVILVIIGLSLLAQNLGFYAFNFVWKLWPLALVAIGLAVLSRKN